MNHWIVAPIIVPAWAGVAILLLTRTRLSLQRALSGIAVWSLLAIAAVLVAQTWDGSVHAYRLGAWPAPYGIVLVLDRLSALMVGLTALLACASWLYAIAGTDATGANYHALFQFQLMGLCGAFLTGDLFNLFVFFEVLLIASYGLLLHGGGRSRIRAGVHYVVFNLVGSALFLIGVGTIYGITGTLNMADLSAKVALVGPADAALLASGALVMLVVFSIKGAVLPLCFWLPTTYGSASAPVAALFAIMTKVGIYSILRVFTLIFGAHAGLVASVADPLLLPLGLLTLAVGSIGAVAARKLSHLTAYLVIGSVGTMLIAISTPSVGSLGAALYYLVHSTVALGGMFLLIDLVARQRDDVGGKLTRTAAVNQPGLLGGLFLLAAVALAGLPPLSGFIGKVLVLESALGGASAAWTYGVVLGAGLLTLIALSRAGSMVFWNVDAEARPSSRTVQRSQLAAVTILLGAVVLMSVWAGRGVEHTESMAVQLLEPADYLEAVLDGSSVVDPSAGEAH